MQFTEVTCEDQIMSGHATGMLGDVPIKKSLISDLQQVNGNQIEYFKTKMVGFSEIAIFVLATSQGWNAGKMFSQYERRLSPIVDTWGGNFPHLHFAFGRNLYDLKFLDKECTKFEAFTHHRHLYASSDSIHSDSDIGSELGFVSMDMDEDGKKSVGERRRLGVHTAQGKPSDTIDRYECPVEISSLYSSSVL